MISDIEKIYQAFERGHKLKRLGAELLESRLQTDPTNLEDRLEFLAYLTKLHFKEDNVSEISSKRAQHIFWLVEHVPEHKCLGEPECMVMPGMEFYDRFAELWSIQISKHRLNARVIGNAGLAVLVEDGYTAENRLLEAERLAPNEPEWAHMLSVIYEIRAKDSVEKADKKHWKDMAAKSMARCIESRRKRDDKILAVAESEEIQRQHHIDDLGRS